jgi:hypothetical protein
MRRSVCSGLPFRAPGRNVDPHDGQGPCSLRGMSKSSGLSARRSRTSARPKPRRATARALLQLFAGERVELAADPVGQRHHAAYEPGKMPG